MLILLIQLFQLFSYFMYIVIMTQVVVSLLIAFNVVNQSNQYIEAIYRATSVILDPFLNPIRKIMPDTGIIDFSPIVLLLGLQAVEYVLFYLARLSAGM